ncbi:hypothetical protein F5Y16DRAFT_123656 [Xylariaceae sp. FL0255]|nr:hypothetical protein F5Y16DRAFT_123656 [Xylariaceae sp. FL0255]
MAFTAVRYPMDKDQGQLPFWSDNDELVIPGDNFFDQFVTFDAGDVPPLNSEMMEDPPSPSILLNSLLRESTDSASHHLENSLSGDIKAEEPPTEVVVASDFFTIDEPQEIALAEQSHVNSELLTALVADPVLSNGSISDSELLRLEGISLKSPRGNLTAPSTPPFRVSGSLSPDKHNRFVESVYATVRRGRPRQTREQNHFQAHDMTTLDAFLSDPHTVAGLDLFDSGFSDFTNGQAIGVKREPIDSHGLPLSPPLTGRIPDQHHGAGSQSHFVTGHLDDPFSCEDILASPAAIMHNTAHDLNTPLNTPMLGEDPFFHAAGQDIPLDASHYRSQQHHALKAFRNGSSAEWPMEDLLTTTTDGKYTGDEAATMWPSSSSSAAYVTTAGGPDHQNPNGVKWWDAPAATDLATSSATGSATATVAPQQQTDGNGMIRTNAAHNLSMHNAQADLPYEYYTGMSNSGLMIHMPQPRAPQASVLSANLSDLSTSGPTNAEPGTPGGKNGGGGGGGGGGSVGTPSQQVYNLPHRQQQQYHHPRTPSMSSSHPHHHHNHHHHNEHRRPRPRAPSSGARYHHAYPGGGAMTSPRKMPHPSHRGYLREESTSPSPMRGGPHPHPSSGHYQQHQVRSSSLSMRKRRSFSRRAGAEPRTLSFPSSSGGLGSDGGSGENGGATGSTSSRSTSLGGGSSLGIGGGGGLGGGGGGGCIDFVNFTANDKNVLMTGVAPSGSSKTKARREKEAMEKSRRISEAAFRAVQDAGGDVNKLMGEFPI